MKYKIIMNKNDFFKIHNRIAASNLEINNDEVSFEVELGSLNILKNSGYSYHLVDSFRIKTKEFMSKYYLLLFGILIVFSFLYINSYRVSKISFNTFTPINNEIEEAIVKSYRKILNFNFSNLNYNEFSKSLREKYIEYPYINVYNKNNDILVDIYNYNDKYPLDSKNNVNGDIVAAKDGIIDVYYVYSGYSLAKKNMYIKKGDVIISGNINNNITSSRGLILGYTFEKQKVVIPKEENITEVSTSAQKYYEIKVLNYTLPINKQFHFNNYNKKSNKCFNLFDFFSIEEIEEYEKNDIIIKNSEETSITKGKMQITKHFEDNKVCALEKIVDLKPYDIIENTHSYEITYIIKKYESLGIFKPY